MKCQNCEIYPDCPNSETFGGGCDRDGADDFGCEDVDVECEDGDTHDIDDKDQTGLFGLTADQFKALPDTTKRMLLTPLIVEKELPSIKKIDARVTMVLDELAKAKEKHPHFVDYFIPVRCATYAPELNSHRARLAAEVKYGEVMFQMVLKTEMYEALDAYANGDLPHARQELAQCAAVCIRGMEYIEDEIAKEIDNA